ncbi:MAG: hypothetical protein GC161_00535 [Planctomycetaceae bacterium]|nr:hypothetical protein [Planctomycetaceae bacterium]
MKPVAPLAARAALATFVAAIPLIAFGGSITTLGAGMAVEGWWNAEGHFMPLFPLEKWLRDLGTFVEHTHRLFGMLVGFLALLTVAVNLARKSDRGPLLWSIAALVAVSLQGTLGGLRVLENSPELAELHGLVAQIVFAVLGLNALHHSAGWRRFEGRAKDAPRGLATLAVVLVFAQIAVGVYYRHGLRPVPLEGATALLHVHLTLAVLVLGLVIWLGGALRRAQDGAAPAAVSVLRRERLRLHALVGLQIALGLVAWLSRDGDEPDHVTRTLLYASLAHVTVGALLLAQVVVLWAWVRRLGARSP